MPLWSNPPHRADVYTAASGVDAGGGSTQVYTLSQSSVPCSVNTASSSEVERFSQPNQTVSHTVALLSSALTTPLVRGVKLVCDGVSYHVHGISAGKQYGGVPAFTTAYCESLN